MLRPLSRAAVIVLLASGVGPLSEGVALAQNRPATPPPPPAAAAPPRSAATAPPTTNYYQVFQTPEMRKAFPRLGTEYRVLGPASSDYNAVSYSVGVTDKWIWPGERVTHFNGFYAQHGFQRQPYLDYSRQPGVDKVIVFGKLTERGRVEVTSASLQDPNGGWRSKPGKMPVIWHPRVGQMSGPNYGQPIALYARASSSGAPATGPNGSTR